MTKSELIEALKDYPDDIRVFVDGYEGGLDDPVVSSVGNVVLNCNDYQFTGRHEQEDFVDSGFHNVVQGLVIRRQ